MTPEWSEFNLKEITTKIGSGATPRGGKKSYKTEGISLIRSLNVHDGEFRVKDLAFIDEDQASKLSNVIVQEGDVLLNITGASIARCCIAPSEYLPARVNQHVSIIRPKQELVDYRFLSILLTAKEYKESLLFQGDKAGATRQALTKTQLQNFKVKLPPLPEQHRIVSILDEVFEGIGKAVANVKKNLENNRELFESYLNQRFTLSAKNCVEKRLGDFCDRVSVGHVGATTKFYCEKDVGVPFLRSQNVRPRKLDFTGIRYIVPEFHEKLTKSQLKPGDLLFVRVGANRGDCCSVPENLGELNCANIVFARLGAERVRYVEYFCQSQIGRERLLGMTTGSAQGVINTKSVAGLIVPLPSIKKQDHIVDDIDIFNRKIVKMNKSYDKKLKSLEELKQSILHKAFTGELTAKTVDKIMEPA